MTDPTRRVLLAAACGTCAAALTGCAAYGSGRVAAAPPSTPTSTVPAPGAPADVLAAAADVPLGGGTVIAGRDVVVTQPEPGRFRAFSATCTHQGCGVTGVSDGVIVCPCHGSTFDISDGAPLTGPATEPLPERAVRVQGGTIVAT